jgi:hypothetical protein
MAVISDFLESFSCKRSNHLLFIGHFTDAGRRKFADPNHFSIAAVNFRVLMKPYIDVIVARSVPDDQQSLATKNRVNECFIIVAEWFRVMDQLVRLAEAGDYRRCGDN